MFNNIGRKIMTLAEVLCWLGILASILAALAFKNTSFAFIIVVGGVLLSWLSSFALYGFGELIENTSIIKDQLDDIRRSVSNVSYTVQAASREHSDDSQPDTYNGVKL